MQKTRKTILLVEDEGIIALDEARVLREEGFDVMIAVSGDEALKTVRDHAERVDLILMDIDLGEGPDGTHVAEEILHDDDIPVVFLSGHTEREIVEKTEKITSYGYVAKNSGTFVLMASIKMAFKLHEAHRDLKAKSEAKVAKELSVEKERLLVTLKSIGDAVITTDTEGRITLMNGVAERLTGWKLEEAMGLPLAEVFHIIHEKTRKVCENPAEIVLKTGKTVGLANHTAIIGRDGTERVIADSGAPIRDEKGRVLGVVLVFRDITERQRMEEDLRKSEEKFSQAFRTNPDSININRLQDGVYLEINQGFTDITGYTPEEVIGRSSLPGDLGIWVNKDDRERLVVGLREQGEVKGLIAPFRCKNGTVLIGIMSAKVMETDGEKCILSVTRDITDRIEMEGRLRKTIQDKEVLLKELQHRVKNSLNIIIGLLSLGLRKIKDERSRQVLLNAQNRIRSMAMIYERLNSSAEFDTIELGPYVDNLSRTLFETYAANTKKIRLSTSLANVKLDVKRSISVGLILNELLTNALKYAFPVGSGEIRIDIEESEETVRLVVQDDGVGLPQGFDQENGDSIGLKLVGLLSEQVGGEMRIEGGQGVCVRVAFRK